MLFISKEMIEGYLCYDLLKTTSTNDEIKSLPDLSVKTVIMAQIQTQGRGRRSHTWISPKGNLYFSYNQKISLQDLSKTVYIVGLSMAITLKSLAHDLDIKIKWPNDIMLNNSKVSGILIENIKDDIWCIGIGVNVTSSPNLLNTSYKATSLQEQGIILDRKEILRYYLKNYQKLYHLYQTKGFEVIKKQWLNLALNLNETIIIKTEKQNKKGVFLTIDNNGYLILKQGDNVEKIIAGELFI